jgi:HEAT repeat protein
VDAHWQLKQAAEDEDPRVRMHALEALVKVDAKLAGGIILQSMQDNPQSVVAAAAIAAGDLKYAPAKADLVALAEDANTPPLLQCAVVYALHRLGDTTHTHRLGALLQHRRADVRSEAARMMGKLREQSAKEPLKSRQSDERDLGAELNIIEALALLGDEGSVYLLEAFTKLSPYLDYQMIAIGALGQLDYARARHVLKKTLNNDEMDPLVRVAAAHSLARLGDRRGYDRARRALAAPREMLRPHRKPEDLDVDVVRLQIQAALGLGYMNKPAAVNALHPMLESPEGAVRVAAAEAILRLLSGHRRAVLTAEKAEAPPSASPRPPGVRGPDLDTAGGKD